MNNPFDGLRLADEPVAPSPEFGTDLRQRLAVLLGTPTIITTTLRSSTMSADSKPTTVGSLQTQTGDRVTPYLTVDQGDVALKFYGAAFGAVEIMRVVMNEETAQLGHAEFRIGDAVFYLSDEFPEMGVKSPRTLGGTSVAMHLEVTNVDAAFSTAVAAGAESLAEPADQAHGARHGTIVDPFGHRWMLSQQIEEVSTTDYSQRMSEDGMLVTTGPEPVGSPGIWAALNFADARKGIQFMVEVLGFEEALIVPGHDDPEVIEHSQLRWPEGGVVQAATAGRHGNVFSGRPTGAESLYVITGDPVAVHQRCVTAGADIVAPLESPPYDPEGLVFTVRDPEGNLWSFGNYAGVS